MKRFFQKNAWASPLAIVIGLYIAYKVYRMYKDAKDAAAGVVNDIKTNAQVNAIGAAATQYGLNATRTKEIVGICENINAAFHKNDWFGFTEDEQKAIDNFNELITAEEAIAAAKIYKTNHSASLYGELYEYIPAFNGKWQKLKSHLLAAIKNL